MAGERTRERGELEGEVMRILWGASEPLSARDIQAVFTGHVPAYTTFDDRAGTLAEEGRRRSLRRLPAKGPLPCRSNRRRTRRTVDDDRP